MRRTKGFRSARDGFESQQVLIFLLLYWYDFEFTRIAFFYSHQIYYFNRLLVGALWIKKQTFVEILFFFFYYYFQDQNEFSTFFPNCFPLHIRVWKGSQCQAQASTGKHQMVSSTKIFGTVTQKFPLEIVISIKFSHTRNIQEHGRIPLRKF